MSTALPQSADVVVVGAGNAAFCAALAAAEQGVSVLVLERAPEDEAGGGAEAGFGKPPDAYDLAQQSLRNGDREAARRAFREALRLDPTHTKNLFRYIRTYMPPGLARAFTGRSKDE